MNLWPARSWLLVDLSPATPPNVPASLVRAAAAIPAKAPDLHLLQEAEAAAHAAVDTLAKCGEEVIVRALDAHAAGNVEEKKMTPPSPNGCSPRSGQ